MLLATTTVEDFDQFLKIFSTKGLDNARSTGRRAPSSTATPTRRTGHGFFDWDDEGWQAFLADPDVLPVIKEAGHKSKPQVAELSGNYDA